MLVVHKKDVCHAVPIRDVWDDNRDAGLAETHGELGYIEWIYSVYTLSRLILKMIVI